MAMSRRPVDRNEFEIAIICALSVEFDAIDALIDINWELTQSYGKARGDPNAYRIGAIAGHNVVIASLPEMGRKSAATTAAWLTTSFPNIKLGLVVGICGAVPWNPTSGEQIMLGDIVISTGIVQYDYGRQYSDGVIRKDTLESNLARPTTEIRSFLRILESRKSKQLMQERIITFLNHILKDAGFDNCQYPGLAEDKVYERNYRHKHQDPSTCDVCASCSEDKDPVCQLALESSCEMVGCRDGRLVDRQPREIQDNSAHYSFQPVLHFGRIASGDLVMKSAFHRDQIATKEGVIAFEMEGAGVWDAFPTVVIKSVCDYADSHKNKIWQPFTAAAAAACMKAFLVEWRRMDQPLHLSTSNNTASNACNYSFVSTGAKIDRTVLTTNLHPEHRTSQTANEGAQFEANTYNGMTMFEAAEKGPPGFTNVLVRSHIRIKDNEGRKLMQFAAKGGQIAIVNRLHSLGEDVNIQKDNGWTPLHSAAKHGKLDTVKHLRILGANIGARTDKGWTPLHAAANAGELDIVCYLHSCGQPVDIKDDSGWRPVHVATVKGHIEVIKMLVSLGADPGIKIHGWTLMHIAAKYGHLHVIKWLDGRRENINVKDNLGRTPLQTAIKYGHHALADHLRHLGARED